MGDGWLQGKWEESTGGIECGYCTESSQINDTARFLRLFLKLPKKLRGCALCVSSSSASSSTWTSFFLFREIYEILPFARAICSIYILYQPTPSWKRGRKSFAPSVGVIAQGISSSHAGYIKSPYKRLNPPSRGEVGTTRAKGVGECVTQSFLSSPVNDRERDISRGVRGCTRHGGWRLEA